MHVTAAAEERMIMDISRYYGKSCGYSGEEVYGFFI